MERIRVRKMSSDSINSNDDTLCGDIEIKSTRAGLVNGNVVSTTDLHRLFVSEREECDRYRVILTVNPYCTNVLYNPCTEIVKTEEVDGQVRVDAVRNDNRTECPDAMGKRTDLKPYDMIRNTEYSSERYNYTYHPGVDIFNNHILRNLSYRMVNQLPANARPEDREIFNTIEDYMRLSDGQTLQKCCRLDLSDDTFRNKHLYDYENVLSFENGDAVNENIREENGWWGFYNPSVIDTRKTENMSSVNMDISRAINSKGNCQFVDMYPDRSLFTFNPQYNPVRNRIERNWDILLTYPYGNTVKDGNEKDIELIQSDGLNGILIAEARMTRLQNNVTGVVFRTFTRHNLAKYDMVNFYAQREENGDWCDAIPVMVANVGDETGKSKEHYFTTTDKRFLENLFCDGGWSKIKDCFYKIIDMNTVSGYDSTLPYKPGELIRENNRLYVCHSEKSVNDTTVLYHEYFVPLDNLIPVYGDGMNDFPRENDAYVKVNGEYYALYNHDTGVSYVDACRNQTVSEFICGIVNSAFYKGDVPTASGSAAWSEYIRLRMRKVVNNTECEYYARLFKPLDGVDNGELYKLAFATTIYGDDVSQITFTDTVDVGGYVDNRGRELTEIFATVIKTNRGYDKWYEEKEYDNPDIECSHCFGPVTCGFDIHTTRWDSDMVFDLRKLCYDVRLISNKLNLNETIETLAAEANITSDSDCFYGDIVEYSPIECRETTICDVNFRFNTVQREWFESENNPEFGMVYDEIVSDDYDGRFRIETKTIKVTQREGYYYKPHYRIRLREFGDVNHDVNRALFVLSSEPYHDDGMYIKVNTSIQHRLNQGNMVILTDVGGANGLPGEQWVLNVVSVIDRYTFTMNVIPHGAQQYVDWVTICMRLNDGTMKLSVLNDNIPSWATRIGYNTYVWRNTVGLWDTDEGIEYPYANNALYVDNGINFYLKRQNYDNSIRTLTDSTSDIELDNEGLQNDPVTNYDYITEENMNQC